MSEIGRFTLSMDFELGWGTIENEKWRIRERAGVYERLRPALRQTLDELDALEVPLTWATVGGMVSPREALDFSHLPDVLRKKSETFVAEARDSTRDGRDLLDMVRNARVAHDVGSHTFSHARFGSDGYGDEARAQDLALARHVLTEWGCDPISFVFPENDATSLAPLVGAGISHARLAPVERTGGGKARKLAKKLRPPPFVQAATHSDGLRTESGTMFFHWPEADRFGLRRWMTLSQSKRALRLASAQGEAIHFWLHPFNLAEIPGLMDRFLGLMRDISHLRDRGELRVETMADLAPANMTAGEAA